MSEVRNKWINAGITLSKNKTATVACPECEDGTLIVKDVPITGIPNKAERYISCNKCGKWNVLSKVDV